VEDFVKVAIICLLVLLGVFLLFREILCWYWKINQAIELLERIDHKLDRLPDKLPAIQEEV